MALIGPISGLTQNAQHAVAGTAGPAVAAALQAQTQLTQKLLQFLDKVIDKT